MVRVLLQNDQAVFCVPRDGTGTLDLPTRRVPSSDRDGLATARRLTFDILGRWATVTPVGFVRNIVAESADDYEWPVPFAHFTVWSASGEPAADGTWVDAGEAASVLADRHWYPLIVSQGLTR